MSKLTRMMVVRNWKSHSKGGVMSNVGYSSPANWAIVAGVNVLAPTTPQSGAQKGPLPKMRHISAPGWSTTLGKKTGAAKQKPVVMGSNTARKSSTSSIMTPSCGNQCNHCGNQCHQGDQGKSDRYLPSSPRAAVSKSINAVPNVIKVHALPPYQHERRSAWRSTA